MDASLTVRSRRLPASPVCSLGLLPLTSIPTMATSIPLDRINASTSDLEQAESPYAQEPGQSVAPTPVRSASPSPAIPDDEREVPSLPPADRGRDAWLFLLGATIIETTVWGLLNAVGILQNYWSTERFPGDEATVTLATSLMNGLSYMSAGFFGP